MTETKKQTAKTIAISSLSIDVDKPMKVKFDNIEFNKLTLLTGMNGTGKSFIMVHSYIFSEVAAMIVAGHGVDSHLKELTQFIVDGCFTDVDTTGKITGHFDNEASIELGMLDGQIQTIIVLGFEDVADVKRVKYMSSAMRTFDTIRSYLHIRKSVAGEGQERIMEEMLKTYKLYDVTYLERLISSMPFKDPRVEEFLETAGMPSEKKISHFDVDLERPDFFLVYDSGEKKYLTTFGAGHQSIFNMLMGNLI